MTWWLWMLIGFDCGTLVGGTVYWVARGDARRVFRGR
jgi:hypothetical protein